MEYRPVSAPGLQKEHFGAVVAGRVPSPGLMDTLGAVARPKRLTSGFFDQGRKAKKVGE